MNEFVETIDKAVSEIDKLQKFFKKSTTKQVQTKDEKEILKAVSLTWFHSHRPLIIKYFHESQISHIDKSYQEQLSVADKSPARNKCTFLFKLIRTDLLTLRNENITTVISNPNKNSDDFVPDFSKVVPDVDMQKILYARWDECRKCVSGDAPMAAVVMMGGLLETLLLSKVNALQKMSPVFTANTAPKNHQGQTLQLKEWGLRNYIDVAHELKWITQTEKDLGAVLMDYRNYIHPFKQKTYGVFLKPSDARILWELCKSISKQLI